MSFHRVFALGNVGRDVELRQTPGGLAVAKFSLATNEVWKDKNGQKQEHTEWFNVVCFGKQAEFCAQYLAKGRTVLVEGTLRTRTYDDDKGNRRYFTDLRASSIHLVGPRSQSGGSEPSAEGPPDFPPDEDGHEVPF
ncbi:MAG: single-stranded DNA-binding protein [Thermoanaerobaculaceae bacterium]|nr:single-stranded DNA-binding protein [Thermoanaerobaculaceae bacterium]MDI9621927.1 single-stranded DNA-binding protein [Acidobacteriota bacterium]NLH12259.1 single-stranded DNA-binding protein [Holophagae bacterium]HPW56444.1 single-stranded DNA-binding protein [Thermoanaerobaculaceae bacterium]